jgi:hypothetical protein
MATSTSPVPPLTGRSSGHTTDHRPSRPARNLITSMDDLFAPPRHVPSSAPTKPSASTTDDYD